MFTKNKFQWITALSMGILFLMGSLPVRADTDILIDLYKETRREVSIAIPEFVPLQESPYSEVIEQAREVLTQNLIYSELFLPVDPGRYADIKKAEAVTGTPKCVINRKSKEIAIGPKAEFGSGIVKTIGDTARGLFGGGFGGFSPFGGGGGDEEPDLADDPIEDKQAFKDPATGVEIMIGGRLTDDGLLISTEITQAPSKGTFHAVTLQNQDCKVMRPSGYVLYKLWEEWKLTVSWTRDRWVDGKNVSHEEGGWMKTGKRDIASGTLTAAAIGTPIWKRMGFDRATEGAQVLGTPFKATGKMLDASKTKVVIHITRPGIDPVKTVPFDLEIKAKPDGSLSFSRIK